MYKNVSGLDLDFNISQIKDRVDENNERVDDFEDKIKEINERLMSASDLVREQKDNAEDVIDDVVESIEDEQEIIERDFLEGLYTHFNEPGGLCYHVDCTIGNLDCVCNPSSDKINLKDKDDFDENDVDDYADCVSQCTALQATALIAEQQISVLDTYIDTIDSSKDELGFTDSLFEITMLKHDMRYIEDLVNKTRSDFEKTKNEVDSMKSKVEDAEVTKNSTIEELSGANTTIHKALANATELVGVLDDVYEELDNISVYSAETIVNPITVDIKPLLKEKTYLDYTFPALIVLIIMFISILLSSTSIMTEKESRAYFRNFITPVPGFIFLFGTYLANILIIFLQIAIILGIGVAYFNIGVLAGLYGQALTFFILRTALTIFIITTVFIILGMIIGYFFNSEETTTLAAICSSTVLLLFSSIVIPLESMDPGIAKIASFNPFVLSSNLLQKLLIHQGSLEVMKSELYMLAVYIGILGIVLLFMQYRSKKKVK